MKKGIKSLAAAALALSALTPVVASASTSVENGVYTTTNFYTLDQFKALTTAEKTGALTSSGAVVVIGGKVYEATDVLSATDAALPGLAKDAATYTTADGSKLESGKPLAPAPAGELKVESVSAINATELQVKFSSPVDSATARNLSNYVLTKNSTKYDTASAVAGQLETTALVGGSGTVLAATEFNKTTNTVTLKLATPLANADKYSVDVKDGVLTEDKKAKVAKYTDTVKTFNDVKAPAIKEAEINGSNQLVLTFDEPVKYIGTVKINDVTVAAANTDLAYSKATGKYTATVTTAIPANLRSVGTHNVVAYDVRDSLSTHNASQVATTSFTISNDVVAPTVASVTQVTGNSRAFDIKFSEPVDYTTFTASVASNTASLAIKKGSHTFTLGGAAANYGVAQQNANTWRVTFVADTATTTNPLYAATENSTSLSVELAGFKDSANNAATAPYKGTVTLNKDLAAPTIKAGLENVIATTTQATGTYNGSSVVNGTTASLNVKFDKAISVAGANFDLSKIVVKDKDGIKRSVVAAQVIGTDNDVLELTLDGFTASTVNTKAPFTVSISPGLVKSATNVVNATGSVTIAPNTVDVAVIEGVNTTIGSAPAITTSVVNGVNSNVLTINYLQKMGESAADLSNYTLDGKALTGAQISIDSTDQIVKITLPEGYSKVQNQQLLQISKNVKTATGSKIVKDVTTKEAFTQLVTLQDNTQPTLEKAEFLVADVTSSTQTNRIKLTFSEDLTTTDLSSTTTTDNIFSDIKVTYGGATYAVNKVVDGTAGDKELVIELAQPLNVTAQPTVEVFGLTTSNTAVALVDKSSNHVKAGSKVVTTKALDTDATAAVNAAKTALSNSLLTAQSASVGKTEGTAVGNQVVDSGATLTSAFNTAKAVFDNASATEAQLTTAKSNLDAAVTAYNNAKVVAVTGLSTVILNSTGDKDSSNTVTLATGETLTLTSSDPAKVTVTENPAGTIEVTHVISGPSTITVEVKNAAGKVIKTGTFTVTAS